MAYAEGQFVCLGREIYYAVAPKVTPNVKTGRQTCPCQSLQDERRGANPISSYFNRPNSVGVDRSLAVIYTNRLKICLRARRTLVRVLLVAVVFGKPLAFRASLGHAQVSFLVVWQGTQ